MNKFWLVGKLKEMSVNQDYINLKLEVENINKEKILISCRLSKTLERIKEYSNISIVGINGVIDIENDNIILLATHISFIN